MILSLLKTIFLIFQTIISFVSNIITSFISIFTTALTFIPYEILEVLIIGISIIIPLRILKMLRG